MNLSDDIIISDSQNLSDEELLDQSDHHHEGEELSLSTFEDQGVSIIKRVDHPIIEVHEEQSTEIMTKSGVEIVACTMEDIDCI